MTDNAQGKKVATVEAYIDQFEGEIKEILLKTRQVILANAPEATEKISWGMPTYHQGENLIHFAAHKQHLGIYPGEEAMVFFGEDLKPYKTSKGAIQLPYNKPIPYELIERLTCYRVEAVQKAR